MAIMLLWLVCFLLHCENVLLFVNNNNKVNQSINISTTFAFVIFLCISGSLFVFSFYVFPVICFNYMDDMNSSISDNTTHNKSFKS